MIAEHKFSLMLVAMVGPEDLARMRRRRRLQAAWPCVLALLPIVVGSALGGLVFVIGRACGCL